METQESVSERRRILRQLDRGIAEAAGYRFQYAFPVFPDDQVLTERNGIPYERKDSDYWHVFSPDGQYVTLTSGITITDLWHGYDLERTYPAYSRSLDAVFAAIPRGMNLTLSLAPDLDASRHPQQPFAAMIVTENRNSEGVVGYGVAWFRKASSVLSIQHAAALVLLEALNHWNELRQDSNSLGNWTP